MIFQKFRFHITVGIKFLFKRREKIRRQMNKCFKQKTFVVCDNSLDFSKRFLITKDVLFEITFIAATYHSKLRVNKHTLRFA